MDKSHALRRKQTKRRKQQLTLRVRSFILRTMKDLTPATAVPTTCDPNHLPVSLMKFAAKLLDKGDVADRLFGSLQVDSSKAQQLLDWGPVITMNDQLEEIAKLKKRR